MKKIWKFVLAITDRQEIRLPIAATVLAVQAQDGALCLWAEVWADAMRSETRIFHVIGTGNQMPDAPLVYVGTVPMPPFVWHVFEELRINWPSCRPPNEP